MKSKRTVLAVSVVVGAALILALGALPAQAEGEKDAKHEYAGAKSCKMCHKDIYKSWEETKHAKSLELLKPEVAKEAKEKYKLDPAKDYTADKACMACHVTGFEKPGGYAIPDPADEKAVKKAAKLAGVGCESCHGPGKDYNKVKKEIKKGAKEGKKYKFAQLEEAGMVKISDKSCVACHNDKSPTYDESKKFDYEKMVKTEGGVHKHVPLELKEDAKEEPKEE